MLAFDVESSWFLSCYPGIFEKANGVRVVLMAFGWFEVAFWVDYHRFVTVIRDSVCF